MIPSRIIQTAKRKELTQKQRAFAANLRLLNPGFEWMLFDDADVNAFVRTEYPHLLSAFDAFRFPIQRFDLFRYLAVHRLGGFYFDLDVLLSQGLAPLQAHSCVFPFEGLTFSRFLRSRGFPWEIGNYAFGAEAGHPFLAAVIENCLAAQRDPGRVAEMMDGVPYLSRADSHVLFSTGPGVVTRTLAESPAMSTNVTVLMPQDICEPASWNVFGDYGVHIMEGSWRPRLGLLHRKMALWFESRALGRLVEETRAGRPARTTASRQGAASAP